MAQSLSSPTMPTLAEILDYALCWKSSGDGPGELGEPNYSLLWSYDLGAHFAGEFSHAVVQANATIEDHSLVEVSAGGAIFVGIFDGHGGNRASLFVRDELFARFNRLAKERTTINEDVLREAFAETEARFIDIVRDEKMTNQAIKSAGTCCLVGVIWQGRLYVANLGDSRVVIGKSCLSCGILPDQVTKDDNCRRPSIRKELRASNPNDNNIVRVANGAWRVRGISQVSRSIGDGFLKHPDFGFPYGHRYYFFPRLARPSISAIPRTQTRKLRSNDRFLIFASDGLWDLISNIRAVKIVRDYPRHGIARRLIEEAIKEAGKKINLTYDEVRQVDLGDRRAVHDDISVVVVFIDAEVTDQKSCDPVSISGFSNGPEPGNFDLEGIN